MKKTHDNSRGFAAQFIRSLARVIDNPDSWVKLYRKGVGVACIQPQTNEYTTRKDILRFYRWENFPFGYDDNTCVMYINSDICVIFDEFEEESD